jgi:uncharacterized BrkB/YihY/UPF0761 family membrane protein
MWIYYSVQVFLFGAAFNEIRTGRRSQSESSAALERPPLHPRRHLEKAPGRV